MREATSCFSFVEVLSFVLREIVLGFEREVDLPTFFFLRDFLMDFRGIFDYEDLLNFFTNFFLDLLILEVLDL